MLRECDINGELNTLDMTGPTRYSFHESANYLLN